MKKDYIMKVAHESPLCMMNTVASITDYDYALVHLFEENKEYLDYFKNVINKRETILDNSIYELGESFDPGRFLFWINETSPTWYVIPDVFLNVDQNIEKFNEWNEFYKSFILTDSKSIGVCQGKSYEDIVKCYKHMINDVDKISFGFAYPFYEKGNEGLSRFKMIEQMMNDNIIDITKPHHLLGCMYMSEFKLYRDYKFIDSIDTSNPVMLGYEKLTYDEFDIIDNIRYKPKTKLYEVINQPMDLTQQMCIIENIKQFRIHNKI